MILVKIKQSIQNSSIFWQKHALQKMFERNITRAEVKQAILSGDIIEDYSDDIHFELDLIKRKKNDEK